MMLLFGMLYCELAEGFFSELVGFFRELEGFLECWLCKLFLIVMYLELRLCLREFHLGFPEIHLGLLVLHFRSCGTLWWRCGRVIVWFTKCSITLKCILFTVSLPALKPWFSVLINAHLTSNTSVTSLSQERDCLLSLVQETDSCNFLVDFLQTCICGSLFATIVNPCMSLLSLVYSLLLKKVMVTMGRPILAEFHLHTIMYEVIDL